MGVKSLSKEDFIKRISLRTNRCNMAFDKGQLDEWIKQGLTFAGERGPNIGRQPTYLYGYRHYRRTLQLARFHAAGIKDRDEILVQLFIREYGVRPHEVRESLCIEYWKTRQKLNASLRSTFVDREGVIPPGRKSQLKRQVGPLDERLKSAGFAIPDELFFALVRIARNPDNPALHRALINALPGEAKTLSELISKLLGGTLKKDEKNESEIEHLIRSSSEKVYELAKIIFRQNHAMYRPGPSTDKHNSAEQIAYQAIYDSFFRREFAAFLFVQSLIIASHQS